MSVVPKKREDTANVTTNHKFFGRHRGYLCKEEFRRDSTPPVREKSGCEKSEKRDYKGMQKARIVHPI